MTWGSNATYDRRPCPHCGVEMVDDDDRLGFTHLLTCPKRPLKWWERLIRNRPDEYLTIGKATIAMHKKRSG
jgi:hypothetical protein